MKGQKHLSTATLIPTTRNTGARLVKFQDESPLQDKGDVVMKLREKSESLKHRRENCGSMDVEEERLRGRFFINEANEDINPSISQTGGAYDKYDSMGCDIG